MGIWNLEVRMWIETNENENENEMKMNDSVFERLSTLNFFFHVISCDANEYLCLSPICLVGHLKVALTKTVALTATRFSWVSMYLILNANIRF